MPKVLLLTLHRPNRSPCQRFRFEQYLPYLKDNGYNFEWSYLLDAEADKLFYRPGHFFNKFQILINSLGKRIREILGKKKYDIIFVQRECFMLGTAFFEKQFAKKGKVIFDFDDSIWLQNVSKANRSLAFLKNPDKTKSIIKISDMIFAGNDYLADYARQFNNNVKVIPTTIDTVNLHNQIKSHESKRVVTIGWTGTHSTLKYLEAIEEQLYSLSQTKSVNFLVISDKPPAFKRIKAEFRKWNLKTEITDLLAMDIGIMPLQQNAWSKGKCGFKILQYLSLGIPAVASPIGVNEKIIQHGKNGFLVNQPSDWLLYLSELIDNTLTRKRMGEEGRETIELNYSVKAYQQLYLQYFNSLLEPAPANV